MVSRAVDLSPIMRMCSDRGPIKLMPWSLQMSTKVAFSDKKPYPCHSNQAMSSCTTAQAASGKVAAVRTGCRASQPWLTAAAMMLGMLR